MTFYIPYIQKTDILIGNRDILTFSCILSFMDGFLFSARFTFKILTRGLIVIPCKNKWLNFLLVRLFLGINSFHTSTIYLSSVHSSYLLYFALTNFFYYEIKQTKLLSYTGYRVSQEGSPFFWTDNVSGF